MACAAARCARGANPVVADRFPVLRAAADWTRDAAVLDIIVLLPEAVLAFPALPRPASAVLCLLMSVSLR